MFLVPCNRLRHASSPPLGPTGEVPRMLVLIASAIFSATITVGIWVLPLGTEGMIEAG